MSDRTPTGPEDASAPVTPEQPATPGAPARGMRAIEGEQFSFADSIGGVRGAVESVLPGFLFVVVFVAAGQELRPALIASAAAALLAVVVRVVQRTPVTQALSGVLGVGIGVIWAWRTGEASDYFAWGLLTNVAYLVAFAVSALVGWPLVGLVLGLFRGDGPLSESGSWAGALAWRHDRAQRRLYSAVTWLWAGMFGLRLVVQVPLFLADQVTALGTAKLVMGLPLTAVVLWLSWMLVRGRTAASPAAPPTPPGP
ncbi:DUF3159 domain-containing protein [Cellulomonas triticagri]|nr:DUF3159 domain-containing protein [Cellulomonas triticagri]